MGGNAVLALLLIRSRKKGDSNNKFSRDVLDSLPFSVHLKDVERGFVYRYFNKKSTVEFGDGFLKRASPQS